MTAIPLGSATIYPEGYPWPSVYRWAGPVPDMYHWEYGIADGTKSCCIQEFIDDKYRDIKSGLARGGRMHTHKPNSIYVPCTKCLNNEN